MNFLILCKFRMEETQYIYAYFQSFFQVDNVDGNINGLEIVLWIRARNEGQDLDSTVDRILTGIQSRNFTKSFGDGSMVQLRTTSSCQDLKCENKTGDSLCKDTTYYNHNIHNDNNNTHDNNNNLFKMFYISIKNFVLC